MTPEEKDRIEQIGARLTAHRQEVVKYQSHEWAKGDALYYHEAPDDVDFLFTLVKNQEVRTKEQG